jgi:hypothetical protein
MTPERHSTLVMWLEGGIGVAGGGFAWGQGRMDYRGVDYSFGVSRLSVEDADAERARRGTTTGRVGRASPARARGHGRITGILSGTVHGFATHAFKHRPGLAEALSRMVRSSASGEHMVSANRFYRLPRNLLRPVCWWPPTFAQRAIRVYRCGFRGLKTARAVLSVSASCPAVIDAVPQSVAEPRVQYKADATAAHVER